MFPSYPNGVMGLGIREAAVARGSRALLVGVGGDEWLGGSRAYYADAIAAREWATLARCLQADRHAYGLVRSLWWLLRQGMAPLLPNGIRNPVRRFRELLRNQREDRKSWLTHAMRQRLRANQARHRRSIETKKPKVAQRRQINTLASAFLAHARELEEGLAAHSGIELRRPFFGRQLVELAFATPEWLRCRGSANKHLHRLSLNGYLPEQVRTRDSKAEFVITFLWHLRDLDAGFFTEIVLRHPTWISGDRLVEMRGRIGDPAKSDSPEWALWTLFGCDALAEHR